MGHNSFSTQLMSRNQDISFGTGSPITCDIQSPAFTCRSSFSSFLVEPTTPSLASCGFSFRCSGDSKGLESSYPLPSMSSFEFFSPSSGVEQGRCTLEVSANLSRVESIHGGTFNLSSSGCYLNHYHCDAFFRIKILLYYADANLGMLLVLPDSSLCFRHVATELENKPSEYKRAGGTNWSRMSGIHSKRNRTIGLGEHEQLDLIVTESVIRWSSCTHLLNSFRSSLVC